MKITANLAAGKLILPESVYPISNRIRTLRDGTRKSYEVILTVPDNRPYDPQSFPKGLWHITGLDWQKDKGFNYGTYGPVKIRTDARQWVNVWKLDDDGDYLKETAQLVWDTCYWLHYSDSGTTLGCIRLASPEDAAAIGNIIARVLPREEIVLEVV
jgi:hypothetical protein